jgi:hypothetical protein
MCYLPDTYQCCKRAFNNIGIVFAGKRALLATCFMLVSCLAYSSTLKMAAKRSSETSVDFQQTAWDYIPDDRTLHSHNQYFWAIEIMGWTNSESGRCVFMFWGSKE